MPMTVVRNAVTTKRRSGLIILVATAILLSILSTWQKSVSTHSYRERRKLIEHANDRQFVNYDYESIHQTKGKHETYKDMRIFEFSSFSGYKSPKVQTHGCNLTAILMDPRLPESTFDASAWFSLESLATYAPYSCVVIQTSSCALFPQKANKETPSMSQQIEEVAKQIYKRALPMFRGMMERGLVRVTILDHKRYKLTSCTDFYTPTNAWMNFNYWNDEFNDLDSEVILMIQTDSVLCRDFDINLWSDLAFVGAPWAPTRWYGKVVCEELRDNFRAWTKVPTTVSVRRPIPGGAEGLQTLIEEQQAKEPPLLSLENYCTQGYSPGFNGGITLRNRTWLLRAIDACPHESFSGISTSGKRCVVRQEAIEDEYFSIILNSLGAPIPTAFEAALFGVETFFAEQVREYYGPYNYSQIEYFLNKRWGEDGIKTYERMHLRKTYGWIYEDSENDLPSSTLRTIPLTFHDPSPWQASDILKGKQVAMECKFLKFINKE